MLAVAVAIADVVKYAFTLESSLQFVVRRRRAWPAAHTPAHPRDRVAAGLDAAMSSHQAELLTTVPAFRSDVLAVVRRGDGDAAALARQVEMVTDMLRGAGVRSHALPDSQPRPEAWVERARALVGRGRARCCCLRFN